MSDPVSDTPSSMPAGWYPDPSGSGQQRWWDGAQWGITASSAVPATTGSAEDERGMATLAQVLAIFTGFLGPLVIWFMARPDQPFVKHHAAEALNFQITVSIAAIVCAITILLLPVVFLIAIATLVFMIIGAIKANEGVAYRFPFTLRLIK